ncbi:MAG: phosphate ABC transporter permease subunit PstC, partial [Bacteroidales bacterium]
MNFNNRSIKQINRVLLDNYNTIIMILSLCMVLIFPLIMLISFGLKSEQLFSSMGFFNVLFTSLWEPGNGNFGFWAYIIGSLSITGISILIAGPICLLTALYLLHFAHKSLLKIMLPVTDILAGIPSVVYGLWGIIAVVPCISEIVAPYFNIYSTGYCLLSASIVLAIMIIPFVLNIMIEILKTVPDELKEASLSLGATKWETVKHVVLRKVYSGILSSFGLGISRAFGETIAVLMVAGNVAKIPTSIFDPVYPLPALIANNYGEMMSIPVYESALMTAALLLFITIIIFNSLSRYYIYSI